MNRLRRLCIALIICVFAIGFVNARDTEKLNAVKLDTYSDTFTRYLNKYTNSAYNMDLSEMKGDEIVKHRMVDNAHNNVSKWKWTQAGENEACPTTDAYEGNQYALRMNRSAALPGSMIVYGVWSPDMN